MIALLRRVRSLNPFGMPGAGPWAVFQKEVRASGRRTSTYWARGLYAAGFCAFIGFVLLSVVSEQFVVQNSAARLQQLQSIAPIIGLTIIWFQFFGLTFCAPLLLGPALCDERRNKTLSALLTTPLTAGQIVAGKLLGQLMLLAVFALVPVPILLAIRVFGGLDAQIIIAATLVTLGAAVLAGSWALMRSLTAVRGISAALSSWAILLLLHGIIPVILTTLGPWLVTRLGLPFAFPSWLPMALCPPWALGMISREITSVGVGQSIGMTVATSLGGSLGVSVLLWILTAARLRRAAAKGGGEFSEPVRRSIFRRAARPAGSAALAATSAPRAERASRVVSDAPVLWREIRHRSSHSRWRVVGAVALVLAWCAFLLYADLFTDMTVHGVTCVLGAIAFTFVCTVVTTSSLGTEREARTLPVLLMTPISERQIVWGKFWGGLARLWPLPALLAVECFVLMPLAGHFRPYWVTIYFLNLLTAACFLCALGVLWSLLIRRVTMAGVTGLLFAIAIWFGIPMVIAMVTSFGPGGNGEDVLTFFFSFNPVALAIACIVGGATWERSGLIETVWVGGASYTPGEFLALCAFVWLGYGLVTILILQVTGRLLRARRDQMA
ncbi:MAG TPA: ABC transporter permease subunit [Phycisphaerales bacterium]|nr:ABC transporter permease subunit [Phycisphaerales bacterium]